MTPLEARAHLEPIAATVVEIHHDWGVWLKASRRRSIAAACLNFLSIIERKHHPRTRTAEEDLVDIMVMYQDLMLELGLPSQLEL